MTDSSETRSERPRTSSRPPSTTRDIVDLPLADTQVVSEAILDVIERDVQRRMRAFGRFVFVLILLVAASALLLGGDPFARSMMWSAMVIGIGASVWMLERVKRPGALTKAEFILFGMANAITLMSAFYYWGVLSGVLVLMPVGVFVFPVVGSRGGFIASAGLLLSHFALSILTISGVIEDRGLIRPADLSPLAKYLCLFIADVVAVAAFLVGRETQFSARRALIDLERATQNAARRAELLVEARNDLAEALHIGRAGRFTGQIIGGMRLGKLLGRGGMGEVYEATREGGQEVAVKLLHPQLIADRSYYARFVREAKTAAALAVENVARVYEASDADAVLPYIVMEKLRGQDLAAYLKSVPKISPREALELVRHVGKGLDAAHRAGVVHRDLKPQNIFRADVDGRVVWKILDFGACKLLETTGTLTEGVVIGTPQYMAPEQARGGSVDHRADLYALGLIAYRALTGRPPFVVSDIRALLAVTTTTMPPRPSAAGNLPRSFDDVMAVAIAKDPAERFSSAKEFYNALSAAARGVLPPEVSERAERIIAAYPWADPVREA